MKLKDLIENLTEIQQESGGEIEVTCGTSIPPDPSNCNCDEYCYCSYQELKFNLESVDRETRCSWNGKKNKQEVVGVFLRG